MGFTDLSDTILALKSPKVCLYFRQQEEEQQRRGNNSHNFNLLLMAAASHFDCPWGPQKLCNPPAFSYSRNLQTSGMGHSKISLLVDILSQINPIDILPPIFFTIYFRTIYGYVKFEAFTAVTMTNGVFWDVTPCGSWFIQEPQGGTS
jgi:hypothetical protein